MRKIDNASGYYKSIVSYSDVLNSSRIVLKTELLHGHRVFQLNQIMVVDSTKANKVKGVH